MAALVASFLPGSWQSTDSRTQRELSKAKADMTSETHLIMPAQAENGIVSRDEVKPSSEAQARESSPATTDQDAEGDRDEEEEYPTSIQEDVEQPEPEETESDSSAGESVKRKRNNQHAFRKNARQKIASSEEDVSEDRSASSSESEVEAEWEGTSDTPGDEEQENAESSRCCFCGQDENDDPSEEFEEPVSCGACGQKAHSQCAREAKYSPTEEDEEVWRCPKCIKNGTLPDEDLATPNTRLRRSSAPKLARDLLPVQRGSARPGSHSIFNNLIVSDDPMDGSRSLRKRKASTESHEKPPLELRKRARRATSEVDKVAQPNGLEGLHEIATAAADSVDLNSPRTRGSRRTARRSERPLVSVIEPRTEDSFTLIIRLDPGKLKNLDEEKRKKKKREYERLRREKMQRPAAPEPEVNHFPGLPPHTLREQYIFLDTSSDDKAKPKPYGGILTDEEANTTRSFPQLADMRKFEEARRKAEDQWKEKVRIAAAADVARPAPKHAQSASKIKCINFGGYEIDTWHAAPYPEEYTRNRVLYICEYCLKYMNSDFVAWRHKLKCPAKHPPGDEIYRDGSFSFFEVDGRKNPVYCQNLCLLAKLFLGSKTLYYDVDPFLFYVMTENDDYGCHFVGYFSKEKRPSSQNNVSCILVLPIHQRRGFGNFLIDFSYLLSRVEGKTGSPEKPLSDMGLVTYRNYWRLIMCNQLLNHKGTVSITDLCERTGMTADDVVCALEGLRALVRDPITKTYALRLDHKYMRTYIDDYEKKGYVKLNEDALMWVPYVMGRDNQHYETAAPLRTVAQRDDVDDAEPEEGVQQATARASAETGPDTASKQGSTGGEQDASTPFPGLPTDESSSSTAAGIVKAAEIKATSATPYIQVEQENEESETIPATRFEIFPPVPGSAGRRKSGRPPKRPSRLRQTSSMAASAGVGASGRRTAQPGTLRRGRSKLDKVMSLDGANDEEQDEKPQEEPASPSYGRGNATTEEKEEEPNEGAEVDDAPDEGAEHGV